MLIIIVGCVGDPAVVDTMPLAELEPIAFTVCTSTSYTVTGLTGGQTYYFEVIAQNGQGLGPASTDANAAPTTVPASISSSPTATPGNQQITLSWAPPSSNGGSAITSYTINYGTSSTSLTSNVAAGNVTSYTVTGLTNGQTYYFDVQAVNAAGAGSASSIASATPTNNIPSAPSSPTATPGNQQITLSWTTPSSCVSSSCTYAVLYWSYGTATTSVNTGSSSTSYTISSLSNGVKYYFEVEATNNIGATSSPSIFVSATPYTVSSAPSSPTATPGNQQVTLSWAPPSSNGGSAITSYTINYGTSSTSLTSSISTGSTSTSYTATGLTNGQTYYFDVQAVNAAGAGSASSIASATPTTGVPSQPTGLTATAGNAQVALSWTVINCIRSDGRAAVR